MHPIQNREIHYHTILDLHKILGKSTTSSPKWWFDDDLLWKKVNNHRQQIKEI